MVFDIWEGVLKVLRLPNWLECYQVKVARHSVKKAKLPISLQNTRTLWVDISVIYKNDAGSGIQRVVRAFLSELIKSPPTAICVRPVVATLREPYCQVSWPICSHRELKKIPMSPKPGDIFLGLDLSAHIVPRHLKQMIEWKANGLKIFFVVYDLLPLQNPHWFSAKLVRAFRRWIKSVTILADCVLCISWPVKNDFDNYIKTNFCFMEGLIRSEVISLGADINSSSPSKGFPSDFDEMVDLISKGKSALMVGTIEPRKGHQEILDAFDYLWEIGSVHNLVIVGHSGWKTEFLQRRIRNNKNYGSRLFWFNNASDEALEVLYGCCTGVIAASYAEGYGLPLIEALAYGKPVLARNLTVFNQFSNVNVSYFDNGVSNVALSEIISIWLNTCSNRYPVCDNKDVLKFLPSWSDASESLVQKLLF